MEYVTLNNGVKMPNNGIGTFLLKPQEAYESVKYALSLGCRLIDTANAYVNEVAVGKAIKDSGIDRSEIFVSTKLWPSEYENENAVQQTLDRLGLDYIDLLFIHQPAGNYKAGYQQLVNALQQGKVKAIGLSNFENNISEILTEFDVKPQVIQVEAHPYFPQVELRKIIDPLNIKIMSWYPLGHGDASLLQQPVFTQLAQKYNKSNAQIVLRWHTQLGFIVIPGSKNKDHIKDNFNIYDFTLTQQEMNEIDKLNNGKRYYVANEQALAGYASNQPVYEEK